MEIKDDSKTISDETINIPKNAGPQRNKMNWDGVDPKKQTPVTRKQGAKNKLTHTEVKLDLFSKNISSVFKFILIKNFFTCWAWSNSGLLIKPEPPLKIILAFLFFFIKGIEWINLSAESLKLVLLNCADNRGFVAPPNINIPSTSEGISGELWYSFSII